MKGRRKFVAALMSGIMLASMFPSCAFASGNGAIGLTALADETTGLSSFEDETTGSSSFEDETTSSSSIEMGDVDESGKVDRFDAMYIFQRVVKRDYSSSIKRRFSKAEVLKAADCDANGVLTANDAAAVLQRALKSSFQLPIAVVKSEQTINVQTVANYSTEIDGKNVVRTRDNVYVDIDLSNVEETEGINNYTFYVTYNPEVVVMKYIDNPGDYGSVVYYDESGIEQVLCSNYYTSRNISYVPLADDPEYADVIGDKTENTLTCAQLGKVKLAYYIDYRGGRTDLTVAQNSGKLVELTFEAVGSGDANIRIDMDSEYADGFNSAPAQGLNYTTNIINSDIYVDKIAVFDSAEMKINAPESVSLLDEDNKVSFELSGTPELAGGKFKVEYQTDNMQVTSVKLGDALENNEFLCEVNKGRNSIEVSFAGTKNMDCNGTLLEITFTPTDTGEACFYIDKANLSFSDVEQNEYVLKDNERFVTNIIMPTDKTLLGDVNYDGVVNSLDAALVLRYDAGSVSLKNYQLDVSDVDKDMAVNYRDAMLILNKAAGYDSF